MAWTEEWKQLCEDYNAIEARCERIQEMADRRAVKALREICPELPNSNQALFYAHNWLVCKGDRKAKFIIDRRNQLGTKLYYIQRDYWSKKTTELRKKYASR